VDILEYRQRVNQSTSVAKDNVINTNTTTSPVHQQTNYRFSNKYARTNTWSRNLCMLCLSSVYLDITDTSNTCL